LDGPVSDFDPERFVYVKIKDSVGPLGRGDKYEDELQELLTDRGLGEITGGGSQLGDDNPDGTPTIAFCGVDIDAPDRDAVVAFLREWLPGLGAPEGTEIHYTSSGAKLQDELRQTGWVIGFPRTFLHPYFEC
jgi:hypothetical protein